MNVKKLIAGLFKIVIIGIVMTYLALHTINFFMFTFPPEQWYLSWLGFGLTGLGMIAYLVILLWDADTPIKKTVALIMVGVCGIGEILAAGFGMQIEAWAKNGWIMTEQDFNMMLLAVRGLAFAHALAFVIYIAGDYIFSMFGDRDHDGIPDYKDSIDNRTGKKFDRSRASAYPLDVEQVEPGTNGKHAADPTYRQR